MKIGLLNIGSGNIFSILSALKKLDLHIVNVSNSDDIDNIDVLIMPGVGAFNSYINELRSKKLFLKIKEFINDDQKKLIGICVGMQALFSLGHENKIEKGLNIFEGDVVKNNIGLNIGLREIFPNKKNKTSKFKTFFDKKKFYFTHGFNVKSKFFFEESYYVSLDNEEYLSFFKHRNVYGFQFHPELSSHNGLEALEYILNG